MKIIIISGGLPTDKYPLNGVFAFDQAKALMNEGHEVYFLSIDLRSIRNRRPYGITTGIKDGIKWYNYSIPVGPFPLFLRFFGKYAADTLFKRFFRNSKPDIIHVHFGDIGYIALMLKKKYLVPYVLTEHSSYMNNAVIPKKKLLMLSTYYKNANALLSVSSLLAKSIRMKTGCSSRVVPNIIDTSIFKLSNQNKDSGLRIVTTALLSKRKRVHFLLQVLDELKNELKDIHIDVIGDGEEYSTLFQYAQTHFPPTMYKFWGLLSRAEAALIYQESDCFVLPSSLETFGVVYVEAMASGLPVIATRCGGPEDFVDDENGLLIDVDDKQQLKEAIRNMYNNISRYNRSSIKEKVERRFAPSVIAKQLFGVYNDVLNIDNYATN